MDKGTSQLPTLEDLKFYRSKVETGSLLASRQLAVVFAALDNATARAEAAEKRVRDMEAAKKELLAGATLVAGFGDGVSVVTGILRDAAVAVDCPQPARAVIAELADVFEANRQKLMDEYSANTAPKRVGTIRIGPV